MLVATVVVSVLLAGLLALTAAWKLSHGEAVVESYRRVGVPEDRLTLLAVILLAGAAGLLIGLWWPPVGIAAAVGLVVYFVAAVAAHVRAGDARRVATPLGFLAAALAALALHLAPVV